jgi:lipooligosaccharide transport system permease protein
MTAAGAPAGGLRWDAVGALVTREWWTFKRVWRAPTFGSVFEPALYLVAFGYGFGALVAEVDGIAYLDYMATGAAAIAVLFTTLTPALMNGFFRRTATHLYDGLLSTPIGVAEVVTAEAAWIGVRAGAVAVVTTVVAALFGVRLAATAVLVPVIGWLAGFGFACLFGAFASRLRSPHQFPFVISGVFLPIFLVSWAFFPLDAAPAWLNLPSLVNPMTHLVTVLRAAALGVGDVSQVALSTAALVAFAVLAWILAVRWLRRALIA